MDIPELYKGLDRISNSYEAAFIATWREARLVASDPSFIPFSKEQIVHHGNKLVEFGLSNRRLAVKNVPDILYTYRARADLPSEILALGHFAIIGRGKGLYALVSIPFPNRFILPAKMKVIQFPNKIPAWVRPYLVNDEQGMLTMIQSNHLITHYIGLKSSFRLQSHLRFGVPKYGQVEIDELYIGKSKQGEIGIGVEAKDAAPNDCLNVSQLFGTGQALKELFPNVPKRLIGAKPDGSNRICLAEFSIVDDPKDLKQTRDWCAYELV
jgi:hypothetical protein